MLQSASNEGEASLDGGTHAPLAQLAALLLHTRAELVLHHRRAKREREQLKYSSAFDGSMSPTDGDGERGKG